MNESSLVAGGEAGKRLTAAYAHGPASPSPLVREVLWDFMHSDGGPEWTPGSDEGYHGRHVRERRRDCESIHWQRRRPPLTRTRVLTHTCECRATIYELCARGGAYFIRRTTRGPRGIEVDESPHVIAREAGELWSKPLSGRAR